uniref:F-box protein SKIP22-like n=1 Tax=Erigeron canadensis TaxID=72917 RepID=UPI001CB8E3EE|nr:F-box protein SKIP22-like [Erigeron canadensis]
MKLRVRSFETKETLKMEVPNPCSLQQLRELVSQKLPSASSTIYLSLNRKDDLTTASPEESIQSIGITSGDLIYYTTNPNGFSAAPQLPSATPSVAKSELSDKLQTSSSSSSKQSEALNVCSEKGKTMDSSKLNSEEISESMEIDDTVNEIGKPLLVPPNPSSSKHESLNFSSEKGKTVGFSNLNSEEISESMEIDDDSVSEVGKSLSVPGFLRKVFTEELGDDDGRNHKLLGTAIRAVLSESGFVEIDPTSKLVKSANYEAQGNLYLASFYYTLSNIITGGNIETVKIRFQNLGRYCKVYGFLVNGTGVHSVLLDEDRLVPFLNVVWANCGQVVATMEENNKVSNVQPEKEVFEFWRKMKDGLALPLLIDLCEKAGFELPPCFMRLPTELKLKILESVSAVDIAKMSCVCSELRYLASSDDLWKQKYIEQFGNANGSDSWRSYKERFAKTWEGRKRRRIIGRSAMGILRRRNPYAPFGVGNVPGIVGGDYDIFPYVGLPPGSGPRLRNVIPNCNLGGLGR